MNPHITDIPPMLAAAMLERPLGVQPVDTTAWGRLYVRQLAISELDELMSIIDRTSGPGRLVDLAILATCDEHGSLIFDQQHREALFGAPLEAVSTLATAFLEFNGMGEDEKKTSPASNTSPVISPLNSAKPIPGG